MRQAEMASEVGCGGGVGSFGFPSPILSPSPPAPAVASLLGLKSHAVCNPVWLQKDGVDRSLSP
jgi:hypothetical protein